MAGQGRSPCASLGFPKGDISYGKRYPLLSGVCDRAGICLLSQLLRRGYEAIAFAAGFETIFISSGSRRNYYAEKCEMRALRQVRQGIRGRAQPHQLRVRRYPRHHLRLRLHQGQSHQGKAQAAGTNTMWRYRELLPVEETTPDTPLRVGWSPLYEEDRLGRSCSASRSCG